MVKRISITDVAREAKVSPMTVSRVIRGEEYVKTTTREKVLEVVDRLGYQPNAIARGLVTQRTGTIGLVMPDVANPFFSDIALAVETEAYEENYSVFLCNSSEDLQREREILQTLQEKRVDGIVLCSSRLSDEDLQHAISGFPAVVLTNRQLENTDVSAVLVDHFQGGYDAATHFLNQNHQKIGYISGPPISRGGMQRAEGFYAAMKTAGFDFNSQWERQCSPTIEDGFRATNELLVESPEITAIFCYNDLVAIGTLKACRELGRNVPQDIAIIGFDDIPIAALVTPALTTCSVPCFELGTRAAELLLTRLKDTNSIVQEIIMRPELVVRDSA